MCEQPEFLVKADWKTEEVMSCLALSEKNDGFSVLLKHLAEFQAHVLRCADGPQLEEQAVPSLQHHSRPSSC